jgi:hypothetical protein
MAVRYAVMVVKIIGYYVGKTESHLIRRDALYEGGFGDAGIKSGKRRRYIRQLLS